MNRINFLISLSSLAIISILILSLNTFYWADDYSFMLDIKDYGIVGNCIRGYYNWDGRYLTLGALVQCLLLQNFQIEFITFFWSILFMSSGYMMYYIIYYELKFQSITLRNKLLIGMILSIVFWLGSYGHISETVLWGIGGVYTFNLFLGVIWILLFNRIQVEKINLLVKSLFLIFSFIAGATTQNLAIALIALVIVLILIDLLEKTNTKTLYNSMVLILLITGIVFIIMAPGNFIRISKTSKGHFDLSLLWFIKNYYMVFVGYIKLVWPLLILSFISATALFFIIFPERKFLMKKNLDKINFRGKTAAILIQYKWLIVAFSTLVPFIVSKNLASPRTAIYFMYFILIFIFIFSFRFLKFNSLQLSSLEVNKKTKITAYILVFLTVISSLILTTYNFKRGLLLKSSIVERELKLKSAKGKIIKINLIDPCLSTYCYKFSDFSLIDSEEYNWIKESQERYFGIKKIIVTE